MLGGAVWRRPAGLTLALVLVVAHLSKHAAVGTGGPFGFWVLVVLDSPRGRSTCGSSWCSCRPSAAPHTGSGCTPTHTHTRELRGVSGAWLTCAYLPLAAAGPRLHLAVVFGGVLVEGGLALAKRDHAAVVGVALALDAEQLPTHHVSGGRGQARVSGGGAKAAHLLRLTAAGRGCTGRRPSVCRRRSTSPRCSCRSSTAEPPRRLKPEARSGAGRRRRGYHGDSPGPYILTHCLGLCGQSPL